MPSCCGRMLRCIPPDRPGCRTLQAVSTGSKTPFRCVRLVWFVGVTALSCFCCCYGSHRCRCCLCCLCVKEFPTSVSILPCIPTLEKPVSRESDRKCFPSLRKHGGFSCVGILPPYWGHVGCAHETVDNQFRPGLGRFQDNLLVRSLSPRRVNPRGLTDAAVFKCFFVLLGRCCADGRHSWVGEGHTKLCHDRPCLEGRKPQAPSRKRRRR